jgi:hypothetical protein
MLTPTPTLPRKWGRGISGTGALPPPQAGEGVGGG